MHAILTIGGQDFRVDFSAPYDISIPLDFEGYQPNAFGIPAANAVPFHAGSFVGSIARGGSANCSTITISPHGNGTHTETVGHILIESVPVGEELKDSILASTLLSVELSTLGDTHETYPHGGQDQDLVITQAELAQALALTGSDPTWLDALVVRTKPNHVGKQRASYSGQNPAYLTKEAMQWVRTQQVKHLLVDLPSVDREEDHGMLDNHHVFWDIEQGKRQLDGASTGRTISEFIFVPDHMMDGHYILNLQVPDFVLDAAPSRPRLFAVERWPTQA